MGCSDFFVGNEMRSRKFSKNLVVPAKAGIHSEVARANSLWIPAFAGTTEGYTRVLPTKYPDEPYLLAPKPRAQADCKRKARPEDGRQASRSRIALSLRCFL